MTRSLLLALCLLSALACDGDPPARPQGATRPNLVLLLADDMGVQLGSYGDRVATTPHLDRLAGEGMRFDNAFAVSSVCSPSRAAILTGTYPHANGHWGFPEDTRLARGQETLPLQLRRAGYVTGLVGKLHVAPHTGVWKAEDAAPDQIPFDFFASTDSQRHDDPAALREAVEAFLARAAGRPFFLMASTHAPHNPYPGQRGRPPWPRPHDPRRVPVPGSGLDTPELRRQLALMYDAYSEADALVGSVLQALEEAGHRDSTLLLFTSDHGPALPGAKTTLFDGGIRVPLLLRWPDRTPAGAASAALVSTIDIAPTLLEAAGAPRPPRLQGRSFLPLLAGGSGPERDAVFAEHTKSHGNRYYPQRAIRTARYKYLRTLRPDIEARNNSMAHWSRPMLRRWHSDPRARFLLERNVRQPREQLFDLATDPDELVDRARDPALAPTLAALRGRLRDWMERTQDPWLALWEWEPGDPDPFEPETTRDGPFDPLWLDAAVARAAASRRGSR